MKRGIIINILKIFLCLIVVLYIKKPKITPKKVEINATIPDKPRLFNNNKIIPVLNVLMLLTKPVSKKITHRILNTGINKKNRNNTIAVL